MSDDIVTRLRNWVLCDTPTEMVMLEAADEIEQLRAKLAKTDDEIEWWSRVAIEQQRMKWEAMDSYA